MDDAASPAPAYMDATEADAPFVTGLAAQRSATHSPRPDSPADGPAPRQPTLLHRQPALHRPRAVSNLSDSSARAQQRRRELGLASPDSIPASPASVSYASEPVRRQTSLRSHGSSGPPTPSSHSVHAVGCGSVSDESVYSDDDGASPAPSLHRTLSSQSRVSVHSQGGGARRPDPAPTRSVSGARSLLRRAEAPPLPPRPASLTGTASPTASPRLSPPPQRGSPAAAGARRGTPAPTDSPTDPRRVPALGPSASHESLSSAYSDDGGVESAPRMPEPPPAASPFVSPPPAPSPFASPPSTSTPRMPSHSTAPGSRATSAAGHSMRSPASDTMQGLFDTFATALADLGLDDAPMDGLDEVRVQYRPTEYPGGSHGLPSSASTLESLLPPPSERREPRAPAGASGSARVLREASPVPPGASPTPGVPALPPSAAPRAPSGPAPSGAAPSGAAPSGPAPSGPAPSGPAAPSTSPEHFEVYGLTVWWPGSFDVTSNINYNSVMNRAFLYAGAANDLLTRPTNLDIWLERAKKQRPNVPDVLTSTVIEEQVRALEAQLAPTGEAAAAPAELPLPPNIPYPLLAKAQSAAHSDPGLLLATPSTGTRSVRRPNASTLIQSLNQLGRRKTPVPPMTARATPATVTPATGTPAATPAATAPSAATPAPPRLAPWASDAPMGLGILPRTPSAMSVGAGSAMGGAVPEPQLLAALARVRDALPDIDEATARRYLVRHQGDDMRAISDYLQEHARDEAPYRRSLFRTPRAR